MKVEINSLDNGSGMSELLEVWGDYNPQNKVFNKRLCTIETDDFLGCFSEDKQDKVFDQMQKGKYIFDVSKQLLQDNCKKWY